MNNYFRMLQIHRSYLKTGTKSELEGSSPFIYGQPFSSHR